MKQGRFLLPLALAACIAIAAPVAHAASAPRAAASAPAKPAKKKSYALRQFTGVVTAVDKSSLTVEKTGKAARTLTFVRNADTNASGEIAKDARVTVYYREDAGRLVARKVVVKDALSASR